MLTGRSRARAFKSQLNTPNHAPTLTPWYEKCQGWALGVARALDGMRRAHGDLTTAFETAKQELFAFLTVEVFEQITPSERKVLASAALVAPEWLPSLDHPRHSKGGGSRSAPA
jgi:hypothetical protein